MVGQTLMKADAPTFAAQERLARYIRPEYRQGKKRAKPGAFMEDEAATKDGLSVNSLEVHTENQIATICEVKFNDPPPFALSIPTVDEFNESANVVRIGVEIHAAKQRWMHSGPNGLEDSYKHDPKPGNESHCLIRYTRLFDNLQKLRFARRMAYKPTYRFY